MPKDKGSFERRVPVSLIEEKLSLLRKRTPKNVLVLGAPKTGKTFLINSVLKEQKDITYVYIDLSKIGMSPESFSIEFMGNICFSVLGGQKQEYSKFLGINFLLSLESKIPKASFDVIKGIHNELLKIKPDQRFLVENALKFSESFSGKRFAVILDNFEFILDINNFNQIKDVSSLDWSCSNASYVCLSSASSQLKKYFKKFDVIDVNNLSLDETEQFVKEISPADSKNSEKIHRLSNGNPYVIISLLKVNKEIKNIEKAFAIELLSKDSILYKHCSSVLEEFLSRTSGKTLSRILLRVISLNDGLRLSEIASKMYRSAPVTKALLERLMISDIIYKKDGRYYFHDSVLKLWIRLSAQNNAPDEEIGEEEMTEVLKLI